MKQQKVMKTKVNHSQRKLLQINSKINNPEKKNTTKSDDTGKV